MASSFSTADSRTKPRQELGSSSASFGAPALYTRKCRDSIEREHAYLRTAQPVISSSPVMRLTLPALHVLICLPIFTRNDSFERGHERKAHAVDYPQRHPEGHAISGCEGFAAINSSDKSKLCASRAFARHCTSVQSSFPSKMDEKEWITLLYCGSP